jgi:ABC-type lipoprotein release transport system permease subunit
VSLALVIGAGAGVSLALVVGARRTSTAYRVFSRDYRAADVIVAGASKYGNFQFAGGVDLARVKRMPAVASSADAFASILFSGRTDDGRAFGPSDVFPVASADDRLGRDVERWKLLDGRVPDPANPREAVASFELARRMHLHVGSELNFHFFKGSTFPQVAAALLTEFPKRLAQGRGRVDFERLADGPVVRHVRIVGIEASPEEFPPLLLDISPVLHLTPAFHRRYTADLVGSPISYVRLRDPDAGPAFKTQVERLAAGQPVSFISTRSIQAEKVQRATTVEAIALAVIGALVALTFVVVTGQALARQTFAEADDYETLRALGMAPRHIVAVSLVRCLSIALGGIVVGYAVALVLSPHVLLGLADKAGVGTGLHADPIVFAIGAAVMIAVAVFAAVTSTLFVLPGRFRRGALRRERRSGTALANVAGRAVLPPAATVGVRYALRRERGAAGVPIWTTVIGGTVTVALLVATWVFSASIHDVTSTPRLYGWNWDLRIGAPALPDIGGTLVPALARDRDVSGLAAGTVIQARIGDRSIDLLGMQKVEGTVAPTIIGGRAPDGNDEIALGTRSMRTFGVDLGSTIEASIGRRSARFKVVGRAVFPEFGDAGQLGTGGLVTLGALDRLVPSSARNIFFIKFRRGTDLDAQRARMSAATEPLPHRVEGWPADLESIDRVSALPELFSALLTALAALLLGHTLLTSVRRRRREFAVLEAIGFVRRQVRTTIVTHSIALVALALLIGVPAGIVAGRLSWQLFADRLGIQANAVVPFGPVVVAVVSALALGAIVAVPPAWLATRRVATLPLRRAD